MTSRVLPGSPPTVRADRPGSSVGAEVEVELVSVPGLGGTYVRGAARSVQLAVGRGIGRGIGRGSRNEPGPGPSGLPDVALLASGLRADAAHLTAYQHLLGESASDVLPAGFVHVLAFPVATALMVRRDFPLPLVGMVHLANRVEQLRPVSLEDSLDVRAWARGLRPHRSGRQFELVTEVTVDGALAWRGTSTYLSRSRRVSDPTQTRARATSDTVGVVGPVPTGTWRLGGDVGRRYAAVSGDRNPIHLSALTARAFGFPRAIAHGMYTASRALATVGPARTDAFTWTVTFAQPVLVPGTVAVRVAADDGPHAGFSFSGWDRRSGKLHLTGTVLAA